MNPDFAAVQAWKQKLKKDMEDPQMKKDFELEPWMIAFGFTSAPEGLRNACSGGLEWMEGIQSHVNRWRRF